MGSKEDFSIEDAFKRLEEISGLLSAPGTSLKDSLSLYTEGVELVKKCEKSLEGVEKEMKILTAEDDNV